MSGQARIRPMGPDDVDAVTAVAGAAFAALHGRSEPEPADSSRRPPDRASRHHHLLRTDPASQWVAEAPDGSIVGAACALVREGVWGLSLLVVLPTWQGTGVGRRLLDGALQSARDARGALIISSQDPRALRRYSRAGFDLHPYLSASGPLRRGALPPPDGIRDGGPADLPLTEAVDRRVRGAAHGPDLIAALDAGGRLLVADGGYALTLGSRVALLAADTPTTAADLLRAALRTFADGDHIDVMFVTGAQQWAFPILLDAGLALTPGGAVCTRGDLGSLTPYLPSGAYL